jgi:hypothetical protein
MLGNRPLARNPVPGLRVQGGLYQDDIEVVRVLWSVSELKGGETDVCV